MKIDFTRVDFEISRKWLPTKYENKAVIDLGGIDASTFRIYIPKDAMHNGYAAIAEIETNIGSSKIKYFDERLNGNVSLNIIKPIRIPS
jgi:hypothetical protein